MFALIAWLLPAARIAAATYTVTTTSDSGAGSLRQAILDANANPGSDTITFAIGASGSQHTIALTSGLPVITGPVFLDGWSQGGSGYAGPPLVEINGGLITTWNMVEGLRIAAGSSTVRGLAINTFNSGILLETAGNNVIAGNTIGLALDGVTPIGVRTGIIIRSSADGNRIGTNGDGVNDSAERNILSAAGFVQINNSFGLQIEPGSDNNWVSGNYIGTDASGTLDRGNQSIGISTGGITAIGTNGDGAGDQVEGNLISGNGSHGVQLGTTASGSRVAGNKIGTDVTGMVALPNNGNGVSVGPCFGGGQCSNHIIGTNGDGVADAHEGNLISGNGGSGVFIPSGTLGSNVVAGNRIGTNASGTATLPNGDYGVQLGGANSRVGTNDDSVSDDLESNLISGNSEHGIALPGTSTNNNLIAGNKIGTSLSGMSPLPNLQTGIWIESSTNAVRHNLISGNGQHGIYLYNSYFNTVKGNRIGVAQDGVTALGNSQHGVYIAINADDHTIGGPGTDEGNVIAFNGGDGVFVDNNCGSAFCLRNRIIGNRIFGNAGLGIDLAPNGVNANDPLDPDTGANTRQNYPVLTATSALGGSVTITGALNSTANLTFTLDFYSSAVCDSSGFGEGEVHLGAVQATTNDNGDAAFVTALPGLVGDGDRVSATATDPNGNTSEFSACVEVEVDPCVATPDDGATVFSSQDAAAVQQAIDAVPAGATVKIAGTCAGVTSQAGTAQTAYLDKALTLAGGYAPGNWTAPDPEDFPTTLDGLGLGRVVFVTGTVPLILQNLDLTNGDATGSGTGNCPGYGCGGGLFTGGSLTLSNVTFQGNDARRGGGAYVLGTLNATNSNWLGNTCTAQRGGAFQVYGDAVLNGGLVQGNACNYGGGIFADSGLVISGTQFISNTATSPSAGSGGAVYAAGPLTITNTLFQGNQAQTGAGAVLHAPGATHEFLSVTGSQFIDNVTLDATGQGGALYAGAAATTIHTSTFRDNRAPGGIGAGGAIAAFKAITVTATTLISNTTGGEGGAIYHWGLNETGSTTQVHPLVLVGSHLAGNQAGNAGGGLYFRRGFAAANTPIQLFDTTFEDNTAGLEGGGAYLGQPGTVAGGLFRENGSTTGAGGGLYTADRLNLTQTTFQDNTAAWAGGAYVAGALEVLSSDWLGNTCSTGRGGAFEVYGDAVVTGGLVQGNACRYAGGLFADAGLTISGTQFISNTATSITVGSGGAVYAAGALDIDMALFQGNQSQTGGGAVLHAPGTTDEFLTIANTQFSHNATLNTAAQGGALYSSAASGTIQSSTFQGNSAPGGDSGGGAIVAFRAMTLTNTALISNTVGGQGGAIYHWGLSEPGQTYQVTRLTLVDSTLAGNSAGSQGGGLYFRLGFAAENVPVHIHNTVFRSNTASQNGGGVYLPQPAMLEDSTFQGNTSVDAAGGAIFASAQLTLARSTLIGNHAGTNGGGLAAQSSGTAPSQVGNTIFAENTTSAGGAALVVSGAGPLDIVHSTLAGTGSPGQGLAVQGTNVQIGNTIVASHTVGILASSGAVVHADHTLFYGNQTDVQGTVTSLSPVFGNPRFLAPANDDYHLSLGSAAIDAAVASAMSEDLDADLRPIVVQSDIGADEFGDSGMAGPATTIVLTSKVGAGRQIGLQVPPGAVGSQTVLRLLPIFPLSVAPQPPWSSAQFGFQLRVSPPGMVPGNDGIEPTFLLPVTITVTYSDTDLAGIDEDYLMLAVLDEVSGNWQDATTVCQPPGMFVPNPVENQVIASTCASGEFALLGPTIRCVDFNASGVVDVHDIMQVAARWNDPTAYDPTYDVAPPFGSPLDIDDIIAVTEQWAAPCSMPLPK